MGMGQVLGLFFIVMCIAATLFWAYQTIKEGESWKIFIVVLCLIPYLIAYLTN